MTGTAPYVSRRHFVGALASGAGVAALARASTGNVSSASSQRPNVLIIQPDQHRGTIMRCAGDEQAITPNLDRLAVEGIRFSNCASASPVCCPFRGTLQTGLYCHTHGVVTNEIRLDPGLTTFAELFSDSGYATGYIGKWHLDGGIPKEQPGGFIPPGRRRQGWQEWLGYEKSHEYFNVWKYNEKGEKIRVEGYDWEPAWHTDMTLDFAKRHRDAGTPWLYYTAYGPPHRPEQCPNRFLERYDPEKFVMPPDVAGRFPSRVERSLRRLYEVYYAQVTAIDHEVGRLMRGLHALGIDRNTIVLYVSDHGDFLGSHCDVKERGWRLRGKAAPYATAFRIPLIIRWPGTIPPNQVCDELVSSVDLTPTILELAGFPVPTCMQGRSMAGWCVNGEGPRKRALYIGLGNPQTGWRAVWDRRFVYSPGQFNILYDHETDPHEMINLIDSADHEPEKQRLQNLLLELAEETADPMLPNLTKT
jgi:arylsulfatase A-like enzyme